MGGNGLVTWAETREESVYAALLIAATPIWTAIIGLARPPTAVATSRLALVVISGSPC
jgi:hypothetical protein